MGNLNIEVVYQGGGWLHVYREYGTRWTTNTWLNMVLHILFVLSLRLSDSEAVEAKSRVLFG